MTGSLYLFRLRLDHGPLSRAQTDQDILPLQCSKSMGFPVLGIQVGEGQIPVGPKYIVRWKTGGVGVERVRTDATAWHEWAESSLNFNAIVHDWK